jgi:glycosyltransferase involved in cell wall biosynthesis
MNRKNGTDHAASTAEAPPVSGSLVVVIPAFNEERFIGSVVLKTLRYADLVIVVDDGSTDDTAGIAEAAGALVVRHAQNQGKGVAINTGVRKAREVCPGVVVLLDGDGQHLPAQIPKIAAPVQAGEADIVVGSRYLEPTSRVPRHRVLGHRFFNLLTSGASRQSVTDSQCGFRAFSPAAFQTLTFGSSGFSVESEMQFLAHEKRLRVVEVPITICYPDKPKRPVLAHGLTVLNGILHLVGQYRPLLFFGVPGLVLLLVGAAWGVYVVEIYRKVQILAVGYTLVSVLLTIIGMVLLSTGVMLHSVRALLLSMLDTKTGLDRGTGTVGPAGVLREDQPGLPVHNEKDSSLSEVKSHV